MSSIDLPTPARVLAIGAHPDDVEFGCGGTIAKWAKAGAEVELLVLTDGSKGTWDPDADARALVRQRATEQASAAAMLGAVRTEHLGAVDGELTETDAARAFICEAIRRVQPTVVVGHDPWKRYRLHPDHRHAGFLTVDALVDARDPQFCPDVDLAPHRPAHLLLFEADEPDHVERIDATIDTKIDALLCHRSQWRSTLGIDPGGDVTREIEAFRGRIHTTAVADAALAGAVLGEAFKLVDEI